MWAKYGIEQLQLGKPVVLTPHGNSMLPRIKSGQEVSISPITELTRLAVNDVVLVKVRGDVMLHLISAIRGVDEYQISNNKGHVNGWVRKTAIYGVANV